MKNKLLIVIIFITQSVLAQQVTLLQPALRDSDMKLDSLYNYDNNFLGGTEKLYVKQYFSNYDNENNPININAEILDDNGNVVINYQGTSEPYLISEHYNDYPVLLPVRIFYQNVLNTVTNEWLLFIYSRSLEDARFSFYDSKGRVEQTFNDYDNDYNLYHASKNEVIIQDDLPIENLFYQWNSNINSLELDYKEIYYNTFTSSILIERITTRINDFNTNTEVNSKKEIFNITTNSFEHLLYNWNNSTNSWVNNKKTITLYNANSKPYEINKYNWSNNSSEWILDEKFEYTYNALNYLISFIDTKIDSQDIRITTYTYDNDNLVIEYTVDRYFGGDYSNTERYQFFYSPEETNAISDFNLLKIKIHPNPATTVLNIDSKEYVNYKIYSVQGKLLKKGVAFQKINIEDLKKGIYFINLKTDNLNTSNKFIVE